MRNDDTVVVDRPNERRSMWWWIIPLLILLLLGIGLLYFFTMHKDTDDSTAVNTNSSTDTSKTTQKSSSTDSTQETITNLATLLSPSDSTSLIGKKVSLAKATVDQVIGDKSFTLGTPTDHVYAILSDQLDSGQAEQAVTVQAGEERSIEGVVVKAPEDLSILMEQYDLTQEQADDLKSRGFYISVNDTAAVTNTSSSDMPTGAGTE